MNTLPQSLVFVDVETTGGSAIRDRVIEIGVVRMEKGEVVGTFNSLINPQTYLPPFISRLTGINAEELEDAPTFRQVLPDLEELLKDAVFVAHNARFDYGFVKNEFRRHERSYNAKTLCTVKLLRSLQPDMTKYNLDVVMATFGIENGARHRALGDAQVLVHLYLKLLERWGEELMMEATKKILRIPTLPVHLKKQDLEAIPEVPGVYKFFGEDDCLLYVGKSINLNDRIRSHFASDYANSTDHKISQNIQRIEIVKTAGDLSALLLESQLVKSDQPLYNRHLRHAREMLIARRMMLENYLQVSVETVSEDDDLNIEDVMAVFRSKRQAESKLRNLCDEHGLCPKLLGLERGEGKCFHCQLGKCKGACDKKEIPAMYNLRFLEAFKKTRVQTWPFKGAVMVREQYDDLEAVHVVDNWCYLGTAKDESELAELRMDKKAFDVDVYKILRRFLLKPKAGIQVVEVK